MTSEQWSYLHSLMRWFDFSFFWSLVITNLPAHWGLRLIPHESTAHCSVAFIWMITTSKTFQRYHTTKRLIREIYYPIREIVISVRTNFANIYTGNAWQKYAKRNGIGFHCRRTAFLWSIYLINFDQYSPTIPTLCRQKLHSNSSLVRCEKTCLTGPLKYK